MADEKDPNEATEFAETLHRHDPDPSKWEQAEAVTGRPSDIFDPNSTLASRAKSRAGEKKVGEDDAEDKAVTSAATKASARKAPAKKSSK